MTFLLLAVGVFLLSLVVGVVVMTLLLGPDPDLRP